MSAASVDEVGGGRSASGPWLRFVSTVGLLVAGGVFVFFALVAPDDGITATSLRQGLAMAAVFAAVPVAALARGVDAASIVSLGGGMTVAGAAVAPSGNLLGPVMAPRVCHSCWLEALTGRH